jgi:hypothetical protein
MLKTMLYFFQYELGDRYRFLGGSMVENERHAAGVEQFARFVEDLRVKDGVFFGQCLEFRSDGEQVIVEGGPQEAEAHGGDGHEHAVHRLHIAVGDAPIAHHLRPPDLVKVGIVAVVEVAHLVGFRIAHAFCRFAPDHCQRFSFGRHCSSGQSSGFFSLYYNFVGMSQWAKAAKQLWGARSPGRNISTNIIDIMNTRDFDGKP